MRPKLQAKQLWRDEKGLFRRILEVDGWNVYWSRPGNRVKHVAWITTWNRWAKTAQLVGGPGAERGVGDE